MNQMIARHTFLTDDMGSKDMKNVGKECNLQMLRNICPEPTGASLEVGNMTTDTTLWGRSFVYLQLGGGFEYFLLSPLFGGR